MRYTDRYLVIGNPIAHSQSPQIHALFAKQTGQKIAYSARQVAKNDFHQAILQIKNAGFCGANVTLPFKAEAFAIADRHSDRAKETGVANTLLFDSSGAIFADNTDGIGLIRDIVNNHQQSITGRQLLILGAGGAVTGVLKSLLIEQPAQITIANRTQAKVTALQERFASHFDIQFSPFDQLAGRQFDFIINGTSLGLHGQSPPIPNGIVSSGACAYDMNYGQVAKPFLQWAKQQSIMAMDGLGMLVEQAAESFKLWRGVYPLTIQVIKTLRQSLNDPDPV